MAPDQTSKCNRTWFQNHLYLIWSNGSFRIGHKTPFLYLLFNFREKGIFLVPSKTPAVSFICILDMRTRKQNTAGANSESRAELSLGSGARELLRNWKQEQGCICWDKLFGWASPSGPWELLRGSWQVPCRLEGITCHLILLVRKSSVSSRPRGPDLSLERSQYLMWAPHV